MRAMIPTAGTVVLGDVAEPAPAIDEGRGTKHRMC